jgi:hypothetical protein
MFNAPHRFIINENLLESLGGKPDGPPCVDNGKAPLGFGVAGARIAVEKMFKTSARHFSEGHFLFARESFGPIIQALRQLNLRLTHSIKIDAPSF